MEKEFVPFEPALELKELGFDEPCLAWFSDKNIRIAGTDGCVISKPLLNSSFLLDNEFVCAPLKQQALRFLREKYCLVGIAQYFTGGYYCYTVNDMKNTEKSNRLFTEFDTYEEAEDACLLKLIELAKKMSND